MMMNLRALFRWCYEHVSSYNLFMSQIDANDDTDDEPEEPAIVLKRQRYATWLYILLLIVSLYVVFFIAWVKPQPRTITTTNITPTLFKQLHLKHAENLSCPCSKVSVSYKDFINSTIKFHPICSSFFVSQQWIEALYRSDAGTFDALDFRKMANSQFKLLANLCSLSKDTMFQNQINLNNSEFVTPYLLSEEQVHSEVADMVELFKNSPIIRITSFINYLRIITRTNYFISGFNINYVIGSRSYISGTWIRFYKHDGTKLYIEGTCGNRNPIRPSGFYPPSNDFAAGLDIEERELNASAMVSGFFAGCTPLEALLPSTLDCLYDIECLELLLDYFPTLNQTHLNWSEHVLPSKQQNVSFNDLLLKLFIEEWSTKMNYSMYFNKCAVLFCTYTTTEQTNFAYGVTLLISLYGGFVFIFRLIIPSMICIIFKLKHCSRNISINFGYFQTYVRKSIRSVKQLNLFKEENNRTEDSIKQQKIITRVYLILWAGAFFSFALFTLLATRTATILVPNPSLDNYTALQDLYPNTLKCPCSTMTIPHRTFISLSPTLHQVCSSDFVSKSWISIVMSLTNLDINLHIDIDWRSQASPQFQLLSDLCQLANKTIDDAVRHFITQPFITSSVLSEFDFYTQSNATLDHFFNSTIIYFDQLVDTVHLHMQVDQPFFQLESATVTSKNVIARVVTDKTNGQRSLKFDILLTGTHDINSRSINCICATNPYCQSLLAVYNINGLLINWNYSIGYIVPGMIEGCFVIDSLMLSTLECFYSHLNCLSILNSYIEEQYYGLMDNPKPIDVRPLVYDPISNRFPPNTSIGTIVKEMMIEKWNPSSSYNRYYESCAPSYCTYSNTIPAKTNFEIIVSLISIIGGLSSPLSLITPYLVKFVYRLLKSMCKRQQQEEEQQARPKWFDRLKTTIWQLITFLYTKLVNLSIFSVRDFGSNVDRMTAKRLGQWATRLYIVLLIGSLAIAALYAVIQPETLTKSFDKPFLNEYNYLKHTYGDKLECSCSVIASKYDGFVKIEPVFHQICSSPFASDEWRINLTTGLVSNLSVYAMRDYRRFLSAHLQYLTGLCQISIQSVNNSIDQFLSSLFVTSQLLSETVFDARLDSIIEKSKSNAPTTFARLLLLIRNINHGNAIISAYGSNFEYTIPFDSLINSVYADNQAIIYDDNCSCGLHQNCTSQANFIKRNSSATVSIKGLKIGCIPTESFLASTLECFYDSSCINLIQEYTSYTNNINSIYSHSPLSTNMSRFSINTTVAELTNNLFIENWTTTINYSSYFEHCAPLVCSYNYIQKLNSLYTVTFLFGLHGGLTIVLDWICPIIVRIIVKVYKHRKRRINIVQPVSTIDTNVQNSASALQSIPTGVTSLTNVSLSVRCSFKIFLTCILLLLLVKALIIFSIYFPRQAKNEITSTIFSTNTTTHVNSNTTTSTLMSTSTITMSTCQFEAQSTTLYSESDIFPNSFVVADLNGDGRSDLAFVSEIVSLNPIQNVSVMFGNGNGTFRSQVTLLAENDYSSLAAGDFNNDSRVDLVFSITDTKYVGVCLGNGNGTFGTPITSWTGTDSFPEKIIVAEFNNDNYLDIAVKSFMSISILLGNGNGSFAVKTKFLTENDYESMLIDVGDFNDDGYLDIVIAKRIRNSVIVFLGYGNGTFKAQKEIFTGPSFNPISIAVGDLNGDTRLDIAFSYTSIDFSETGRNGVGMLFGHGNGTLSQKKDYLMRTNSNSQAVAVGDFNEDGFLDVIVGGIDPYAANMLLGRGNGIFEEQMIFSTEVRKEGGWNIILVHDFNDDDHQDIVIVNIVTGTIDVLLNTCECCTSKTHGTNTVVYQ